MDTINLQMAQRGVITLPKSVRERYCLKPGDGLVLFDMDGILVLAPATTKVDRMADQIARALAERGESLESMTRALREARERYAD